MIVLDTNVVSEMVSPRPSSSVLHYLHRLDPGQTYLTAITAAELLTGCAVLPPGKRRSELAMRIEALLQNDFAQQILVFDAEAAHHYAEVSARRRALGRPLSLFDGLILAIARAKGATIVTRNVRDFEFCDVPLVNPWELPG